MAQKIFIHNITKGFYNEELGDAVEKSDKGDLIKFSYAGCSLMIDLITLKEDKFNEYQYVKDRFLEYFKEFHEESFT